MVRHVCWLLYFVTARWTIVQSVVLWSHVVCPSVSPVTLVGHDHIGWKSWKLIVRTISPTSSLLITQRSSTTPRGTWRNLGRKCAFNTYVLTSIASGWIESTESCDLRWRCGCLCTFVGASCGHLCDSTAFSFTLLWVSWWHCTVYVTDRHCDSGSIDRRPWQQISCAATMHLCHSWWGPLLSCFFFFFSSHSYTILTYFCYPHQR